MLLVFLFLLLDFQGLSFLPFNTTKIIKNIDLVKLFQYFFTEKRIFFLRKKIGAFLSENIFQKSPYFLYFLGSESVYNRCLMLSFHRHSVNDVNRLYVVYSKSCKDAIIAYCVGTCSEAEKQTSLSEHVVAVHHGIGYRAA